MTRCVTDLALERFLLDELTGADREHILACGACQASLAAKRSTGDAYLASPAARALAATLAAIEPSAHPRSLAARALSRTRVQPWLAVAAAAAIVVAIVVAIVRPGTGANDREAEVLATEHAWMQAYLDNDATALDAILAADYTFTDASGGVTTKADDLRNAHLRRIHFDAYDNSDVHVHIWGNTAVVTGKSSIRGTNAGHPFANLITFTDTLSRIEGHWRAVAAHVSRVR